VTLTALAVGISAAVTAAVRLVELTNVVAIGVVPNMTVDPAMKPVPVKVTEAVLL